MFLWLILETVEDGRIPKQSLITYLYCANHRNGCESEMLLNDRNLPRSSLNKPYCPRGIWSRYPPLGKEYQKSNLTFACGPAFGHREKNRYPSVNKKRPTTVCNPKFSTGKKWKRVSSFQTLLESNLEYPPTGLKILLISPPWWQTGMFFVPISLGQTTGTLGQLDRVMAHPAQWGWEQALIRLDPRGTLGLCDWSSYWRKKERFWNITVKFVLWVPRRDAGCGDGDVRLVGDGSEEGVSLLCLTFVLHATPIYIDAVHAIWVWYNARSVVKCRVVKVLGSLIEKCCLIEQSIEKLILSFCKEESFLIWQCSS
jgi:hypothetical protein